MCHLHVDNIIICNLYAIFNNFVIHTSANNQLDVDHFFVSNEIFSPGVISMKLYLTITTTSLYANDFVIRVYVSRSPVLSDEMSLLLQEYTISEGT